MTKPCSCLPPGWLLRTSAAPRHLCTIKSWRTPSRPLGPTVVPANPLVAHAVSTAMYVQQDIKSFTIAATLPVRQLPHDQNRACVCVWVCGCARSPSPNRDRAVDAAASASRQRQECPSPICTTPRNCGLVPHCITRSLNPRCESPNIGFAVS